MFRLALQRSVVKSALLVALVVGTLLNIINQGDAIFTSSTQIVWWKLVVTYLVPYFVSTYGALMAFRSGEKQAGGD